MGSLLGWGVQGVQDDLRLRLPCLLAVRGHCLHSGGCGGLSLFMTDLPVVQNKVKGNPLGDGGGSDLEVGSMVLHGQGRVQCQGGGDACW